MNDLTNRRSPLRRLRTAAAITAVLALATISVASGAVAGASEAPPTVASPVTNPAPGDAPVPPSTTAPAAPPDESITPPTVIDETAPVAEVAPDPTTDSAAEPATARAAVTAAASTPAVNVTPTTGLNPAGGSTIAVSGSGFSPTANSGFGVYAVFGPVDPGTYFEDANRFLAAVWLHVGGGASGSPGQGELNANGTFATTLPPAGALPLTARYTDGNGTPVDCLTTQCYVVTIAAHGVSDRSQDTCTPISFAGGTATPGVDRSCRAVSTPAGQPNDPGASGAPNSNGNGTGTGANGSGNGSTGTGTSGNSSTLPKTGTGIATLGGLGLALVAGGLLLVQRARRSHPQSHLIRSGSGLDRST